MDMQFSRQITAWQQRYSLAVAQEGGATASPGLRKACMYGRPLGCVGL
jgi:hypothetical protein